MRAGILVLLIVLAGCASPTNDSTPPETRAAMDLARFLAGLYEPSGRFANEPAFRAYASETELALPNGTRVTLRATYERGLGNETLDASEAAPPVPASWVLCKPEGLFLRVGSTPFAVRRPPGVPCGGGSIQNGPPGVVEDYTLGNATRLASGGVRSEWTFPGAPPGTLALESQADGTVARAELTVRDTRAVFSLEYGARSQLPGGTGERLPADVSASMQDDGTTIAWRVTSTEEKPLLREMSLRVWEQGSPSSASSFRLDAETATADGIVVTYADADGDSRASVGDHGTIARADGSPLGDLTADLFDEWAGRAVRDRAAMLQQAATPVDPI